MTRLRTWIRWVHIPIADFRDDSGGPTLSDQLEKAADALADPANQPVFFHCHHGVNRTSMAQIAYRTLHCGWTLEEATAEVARTFDLKRVDRGPDYRFMEGFYEERVLPRRSRREGEPSPRQADREHGVARR